MMKYKHGVVLIHTYIGFPHVLEYQEPVSKKQIHSVHGNRKTLVSTFL